MSDNTIINSGAGGDTIASDDIAGVKYQRVKIITGSDGVNSGDVSTAVPLPVAVITVPTLTKGTQGSTGLSVQLLKDAGRAIVNAATAIAGVTAVTAEALLSFDVSRDAIATAPATSIAVTAGKRYRITSVSVGFVSTAAAVLSGRFALRMNPAGAATATSPIIAILAIPSGPAVAGQGGSQTFTFPDGLEISGTQQIALTQVCSAVTGTVWATITGFEY